MIKIVKKILKKYLPYLDIYPARITRKEEMQKLLNKLRPVSCGMELIRLGPDSDGGYLVPDDLEGIKVCFSAGVGSITGFENDCANMGMNIYLADNSLEVPPEPHKLFNFTNKNIGITTNNDFMTIDNWVASSVPGTHEELLLQIDIEGSEYEVFLGASDQLLNRSRIIVVEFHKLNHLWNRPSFNITSRVFDKLMQTHSCVHIHPNNNGGLTKIGNLEIPHLLEITFLRNDRVRNPSFINTFPHPLDCDNTKKEPLYLPKCWYT